MAVGMDIILCWRCCGGDTIVATGRQAEPRDVFSRAIAAIFPKEHDKSSNADPFSFDCSRPTNAEAELIIDVN
jgi:hypothetical protein